MHKPFQRLYNEDAKFRRAENNTRKSRLHDDYVLHKKKQDIIQKKDGYSNTTKLTLDINKERW